MNSRLGESNFNLTVSGNISRDEIKELENELKLLNVYPNKLETFSAEIPEYINLAFRNFDTIVFLRDFILAGILTSTITKIYAWSKTKRNKEIREIWIIYIFNIEGKKFSLNIHAGLINFEKIFNEAKQTLTIEFIQKNIQDGAIISFSWNEKENEVDSFIQ